MNKAQFDAPGIVDDPGSLRTRDLTILPSELWSPEFRQFHASLTSVANVPRIPVPARTASPAEWARFDALRYERYHAACLARLRAQHPVSIVDTKLAGVRVGIIEPKDAMAAENKRRVLINLHGGGFVYDRGLAVGQLESIPVAALGRMKVITLDYRQAPFHRYPAASEDVAAVYEELLRDYEPEAIGIYGCSAGGTLTAQAVAWFQSQGLPRPGAIGVFSIPLPPPCVPAPWGSGWGDSTIWFASPAPSNELSAADRARWEPAHWYMEGVDANDPQAYPGSSDAVLAQFPATLFLSGTRDFALSATATSHARLLKLGVDSALYIIEGAIHGAHVYAVDTPEARDAHAYVARWFMNHLAQ